MKQILAALMISGLFCISCNNSGSDSTDTKATVDSLNNRKDTLNHNIDSSSSAKIDSIKTHASDLRKKLDSSIDVKKDSVKASSKK